MKFVISTQEFNFLLSKCNNVVALKPTIPILSNFLIEAVGNDIVVTATDLTVGIRCQLEGKVIEEGAVAIPARRFSQLLRELTTANVEVSANANDLVEVSSGASRFKINGMTKSEYPALPDVEEAAKISFKEHELKEMLYKTSFSVSKEDNRYALTGVLMQVREGRATFAGTDGKRLSRSFIAVDVDKNLSGSWIIPYKAVDEVMKNLTDSDDEVSIYLMDDKIAVDTQTSRVITKLLTGDFPDISRIIPQKSESIVTLHREELMSLLRQVSLFTTESAQSVRFSLSEGELRLMANTSEVGEGKVSMPANYTGPNCDIAFNPIYFLDVLRHSKSEVVSLLVSDAYSPGVVTDQEEVSSSPDELNPLFVLMPMRLNEE